MHSNKNSNGIKILKELLDTDIYRNIFSMFTKRDRNKNKASLKKCKIKN